MYWYSAFPDGVSIHAPTKGATSSVRSGTIDILCFNPRSHEGSDPQQIQRISRVQGFNPRSHEGSDGVLPDNRKDCRVSIHAPTKGATADSILSIASTEFQSTLPRRERRTSSQTSAAPSGFNPRSHEGSDLYRIDLAFLIARVSIHAPTKGATFL